MTTLVALDGVLRARSGNPIPEGRSLFEAMKRLGPVVVLADGTVREAEHWLRTNNVVHDDVVGSEMLVDPDVPLRRQQVLTIRSRGRLAFLVEADAGTVGWAVSEGIPSLFFVHPQFAAPVSRRDTNVGRRTWEEIQAEVDRRQQVAAGAVTQEDDDADL